jgi:hypothetical protein
MRMMASKVTQIRALITEKSERMPAQWIEHERQCAIPISTMIIQAKVKSLIENQNTTETSESEILCCQCWVVLHLKGCHAFHNLQLTGKASAADLVPAEKFASDNYKAWIFAPASIQSALLT